MRLPSSSFATVASLAGLFCLGLPNPAQADSPQAAAGCAALPAGAVAWWRAEGTASDAVGFSPGTLGEAVRFTEGRVGQAFLLDGSGGVEVPHRPDLNLQAFTVEGWVYATVVDGVVDIILNKEGLDLGQPLQYEIGIKGPKYTVPGVLPVGNLAFALGGITGLPDDYGGWTDGGGPIPLNEWVHVAWTFEPGRTQVFINGVLSKSYSGLLGTVASSTGPLRIGSRSRFILQNESATEPFNGRLDEMTVYNRALSAAEIQAIYAAGSQGKCPPLYPTNDGISESWRERYFGASFRSDLRAAATADPDGDGANNFLEFLEASDPLNPLSTPRRPVSVSTWAGSIQGSIDGFRTEATFFAPGVLAPDRAGRIWLTEAVLTSFNSVGTGAHRIRIIGLDGNVGTFAGSEQPGLVEGPASEARFRGPSGLVFDSAGNAFVTDRLNHRIRKIDPNGLVSTFVGSGEGYRDGTGAVAQFASPIGLAIDAQDNLYVADFFNLVVRKVSSAGEVSTYAGRFGVRGRADGDRLQATFDSPHDVAVGDDGTVWVADWSNGAIRRISSEGIVTTVAQRLNFIEGISVDGGGNVYAAVAGAHGLYQFRPDGTLAWSLSNPPGFRDGPAAEAQFARVGKPLLLPDGDLLVSDSGNYRIRRVAMAIPKLLEVTPAAGVVAFPINVSLHIRVTDLGAATVTIRYTVDGEVPTAAAPAYSALQPILLTQPATVQARLFVNDNPVSDVLSATYTGVPPQLTLLPLASLFTNTVDVSIEAVGLGPTDVIRYTLDGSDPVPSSPVYARPIRLSAAATVKARAFRGTTPLTDVVSRTYARVYAVDDGISAEWRRRYFGDGYVTDPRVAANADPDGDGSPNLQEFAAGSDPTDPLSGFAVRGRLLPAVIWRSVPGQTYRILVKDKLDASVPWTPVTEVTATEAESRYIDLNPENAGKYFVVEPVR